MTERLSQSHSATPSSSTSPLPGPAPRSRMHGWVHALPAHVFRLWMSPVSDASCYSRAMGASTGAMRLGPFLAIPEWRLAWPRSDRSWITRTSTARGTSCPKSRKRAAYSYGLTSTSAGEALPRRSIRLQSFPKSCEASWDLASDVAAEDFASDDPLQHLVSTFVDLADLGIPVDRLERPSLIGSCHPAREAITTTGLDRVAHHIDGKRAAFHLGHCG